MKWLLKWAGWQAYVVFAAIALAVVLAWVAQVSGLKAEISEANSKTFQAEKKLSDRIAAEATAVSSAVTKAREEEQIKLKDQETKYEKLLQTNKDTRLALAGSEQRLRKLAAASKPAAGPSSERGANSPAAAIGISEAAADELRPEDGVLIGELLQIAGDAKQAAEERNWLADQYITQCERK